MGSEFQGFTALPGEIRLPLALRREYPARQIDVSLATVSRRENGRSKPSRLAETRFAAFCGKMTKHGRPVLRDGL